MSRMTDEKFLNSSAMICCDLWAQTRTQSTFEIVFFSFWLHKNEELRQWPSKSDSVWTKDRKPLNQTEMDKTLTKWSWAELVRHSFFFCCNWQNARCHQKLQRRLNVLMYRVPSQQRRTILLPFSWSTSHQRTRKYGSNCVCVALERSCAPTLRASGRVWERRHDEPLTHTNSANFRSFPSILLAHVPPPTSFSSHRNPAAAAKESIVAALLFGTKEDKNPRPNRSNVFPPGLSGESIRFKSYSAYCNRLTAMTTDRCFLNHLYDFLTMARNKTHTDIGNKVV